MVGCSLVCTREKPAAGAANLEAQVGLKIFGSFSFILFLFALGSREWVGGGEGAGRAMA